MTVAEMIKKTRTEANMTQEEYGLKFGVTRQTVSSWENARSMPDLQMLIDICNTYHISLDKLLNEDKDFVDKIDFYGKLKKYIKPCVVCAIIVLILFLTILGRWYLLAKNKNEEFANNVLEMGFVLDEGVYRLEDDEVYYQLPNQKLPFLKDDFYVKNSHSEFNISDMEIEINIYDNNSVAIIFNHFRSIKGYIDKNGELNITENTLNSKETEIFNDNRNKIDQILDQLLTIHNFVYSY